MAHEPRHARGAPRGHGAVGAAHARAQAGATAEAGYAVSAWRDCPRCPVCRVPAGSSRAAINSGYRGQLMCCSCGVVWTGTAEERAQAKRVDRAWGDDPLALEQRCDEVRKRVAAERRLARELFLAAGKPLPEWLR